MTRIDRKRTSVRRSQVNVEALEDRQLLSAAKVAPDAMTIARLELKSISVAHEKALFHHDMSTAKVTAHEFRTLKKQIATAAAIRRAGPAIVRLHSPLLSTDFIKLRQNVKRKNGQVTYAPPVGVFTPSQLNTAYSLNTLPASNQGQGTTIAIVDELADPTITTNAQMFSTQYNLPQLDGVNGDGTFNILKDGNPGTSPGGGNGTSIETTHCHSSRRSPRT